MDKIEKIKNEMERLYKKYLNREISSGEYFKSFNSFIESLQEEPVSEDLEEAAEEWDESLYRSDAFKAGANWQKEQFEKNRLAACDAQTKEEADREMDFVEKMIMEDHRQPTYSDAIEYGMRGMKQQMMKDSIDATIEHMPNDYGEFRPCIHVKVDRSFKKGEKVKVIIIKEEQI